MVITTGSFPKGLGGGSDQDEDDAPAPKRAAKSGAMGGSGSKSSSDCTRSFLSSQEKGYSPRKGMAAGIIKC